MSGQILNEDIKQCVLIAQPFGSHFPSNPLFLDFNSVTVLEFNLSWLVQQQVKECFVVYTKSKEQVQKFIKELDVKEMKMIPRYCNPEEVKTVGDIMRQLYFHQDLAGDFLLVHGNIITNLNLKDLWREHLARKQLSAKQNILTVALQNSKTNEFYVLNKDNNEILQIHDFNKKFKLNTDRIKITGSIQDISTRGNLSQAGIYACSLDVVKGFKETFEHQNINDFIIGILTSQIYSERIYSYVLKTNQKCIRIDQPFDYYKAYQLFLNRYFYPYLVQRPPPALLKNKIPLGGVQYLDYNKYLKTNINLQRGNIRLSHNIYIGEESKLETGVQLFMTITCRNTTLQSGCTLKNCIVLENTVVPENYQGENSLLRGSGDSFEAITWEKEVAPKAAQLESQELFAEEAEEGDNFEEDLKIIMSEIPTIDTHKQLSSLRKVYNKTCREFIATMISNLHLQSKQVIGKVTSEWGELFKKTSPSADELLSGVADSFAKNQSWQPLFPFFIMYMYQKQHLNDEEIITWYDSNKEVQEWKVMITKSAGVVDKLREEDQQDD